MIRYFILSAPLISHRTDSKISTAIFRILHYLFFYASPGLQQISFRCSPGSSIAFLRRLLKLAVVQVSVETAGLNELVVGALLHNVAVPHD